jgi:hypothetical protein
MTPDEQKRVAAINALQFHGCAGAQAEDSERVRIVSEHLGVIDGDVRVVNADGNLRTVPSLTSGEPVPYPIERLVEDLIAAVPRIRWRPL